MESEVKETENPLQLTKVRCMSNVKRQNLPFFYCNFGELTL